MIGLALSLLGRPAMLGWALAGLMALTGGVYAVGRNQGAAAADARYAAAVARLQTQMIRAAEIASRNEAARLIAQARADKLAKELEDAARTDAHADRIAIGADSVRRLNRR